MPAHVTLRLDFPAERRLGHGKVSLLEAVRRNGSIAAAGREFGMSYRRAWLLVDEMNRMFREPVVTTRGGGRNGGGAVLTEMGETVIRLYRLAEGKILKSAGKEIDSLEAALAPLPDPDANLSNPVGGILPEKA
jgi:molybdate transport system regulatory protein